MNDYVLTINYKYENKVIRELPTLITRYIEKHPESGMLFINKGIKVDDILRFLANKPYKTDYELMEWVVDYVEARNGILERLKRRAASCSNN